MTALTSMSMQHASHIRTFNNSERLKRYRSVAEPVIGNSYFLRKDAHHTPAVASEAGFYDACPPEDEEMVASYADRRGF